MSGKPRSEAAGAGRRRQRSIEASTTVARLCADASTAQQIADFLTELLDPSQTAVGTFDGPGDKWTVEASFGTTPDRALVRKLVEQVAGKRAGPALAFETLSNPDWVQSSLADLRPVEAGRFVVHGRHDRHRIAPNRVGVEIEAALAFGTGHHGTTRGCLLALDRILKARRPRRVLDLGTGTGVLAIAAANAVRARVLASDVDPVAVRTARENARRNAAAPRITILRAAGVTSRALRARAPFDLVLANILLRPLQRFAFPLAGLLAPNARVILSGLLPSQANAALSAYAAHRLRLERRITLDDWITLVLIR